MGPLKQLKKMFAMTRIVATIVMLVALVMTLVSAFAVSTIFTALNNSVALVPIILL